MKKKHPESSQINLDVLNDLKTGDLLLFNDNSSGLFGWFTKKMINGGLIVITVILQVLKDPTLDKNLKDYIFGNLVGKKILTHKIIHIS